MRPQSRRRVRRRVRRRLRRGAYLLPSLFTTANLLLGFYSIVTGLHGNFQRAAILVFVAAILDGLDGRIARMTHTESDFGREYDSLADLFAFGAAPALLCYVWGLNELGRAGWLVPLFFMVCAAARLARFNVQTRVVDSRYFAGLPSPAAAATVCSVLFFVPMADGLLWALVLVAVLVATGVLMVSTFRYPSLKRIDLRQRRSYRALLPLAAALLVVAYHPPAFFLAVAVLYALSGPVGWLAGRLHPREPDPAPAVPPGQEGPAEAP
jgi:CDP-diacylglycerol--serine O-phosphatidyltransferase